ncbi:MAG: NAD(P)H-binding protein [Pseudonocardiaceae bacterium]
MKVFVAGATGVLGRRAVPQLVEAGHTVTGVARSEEKAALVQKLGAEPPVGVPGRRTIGFVLRRPATWWRRRWLRVLAASCRSRSPSSIPTAVVGGSMRMSRSTHP